MLQPRNKRIHTDYSRHLSSHHPAPHHQPLPPAKRKATLTHDRQSYITRTLNSINHEVKYDKLSDEQIQAERGELRQKVKEINAIMNGMLGKELEKRIEGSRVSKKATIGNDMGIDYNTLCKEAVTNVNKIQSLQDELEGNLEKLSGMNNVDARIDYGRRVAEVQIKIKQLKQQLSRIKKNKLLRQKQIMKGSIKQNEQIHTLQQEYINYTRKAELITTRLQVNQQELVDSEFSIEKQRDLYDELRVEYSIIEEIDGKLNGQQEELLLMHNNRRKKVELFSKRNEKEEEGKKKKYYNLLLEYQECKNREKHIDEKINFVEKKNQVTLIELSRILEHLKSLSLAGPSRKSLQNYKGSHSDYENIFEMTEANPRQFSSQKSSHPKPGLIVQNRLNKNNATRRLVRQWNLQGSIIRQNLSPSEHLQSIDQAESEQSPSPFSNPKSGTASGPRYRKSTLSKQIQHFRTENSQHFDPTNHDQPSEQYQQDFQI